MVGKKGIVIQTLVYWLLAFILFYLLTSAEVSTNVVQEDGTVEKFVNVTRYREEKVPFGEPTCMQANYNYSSEVAHTEKFVDGRKVFTCVFFVKNEEDIMGRFNFYPQLLKSGKISDGPNIEKLLDAFERKKFEWNFTVDITDTVSCMLQIEDIPDREKCLYLEDAVYELNQVPYLEQVLKNVTVKDSEVEVERITYTNRFFGYKQFFYFGY